MQFPCFWSVSHIYTSSQPWSHELLHHQLVQLIVTELTNSSTLPPSGCGEQAPQHQFSAMVNFKLLPVTEFIKHFMLQPPGWGVPSTSASVSCLGELLHHWLVQRVARRGSSVCSAPLPQRHSRPGLHWRCAKWLGMPECLCFVSSCGVGQRLVKRCTPGLCASCPDRSVVFLPCVAFWWRRDEYLGRKDTRAL